MLLRFKVANGIRHEYKQDERNVRVQVRVQEQVRIWVRVKRRIFVRQEKEKK